MSFACENTVFDFDLDFLNQPPTNNAPEPNLQARADRLRKSVIFLKKRVKNVDDYVTNHYIQEKRILELENNENQRKNECIQHHIELNNFIEKVTRLESDILSAEADGRKKNETICELQNKISALQTVHTQLKILVKEKNKVEITPGKDERRKSKASGINIAKKGSAELEVETLRKKNARILILDKENEKLRKENAKILILDKENEKLRQETARILILDKENEKLRQDSAKILILDKENEKLRQDTAKILILDKENEKLRQDNAKLPVLEKEIECLRKKNIFISKSEKDNYQNEIARIQKLEKEIETLRKENDKITKLEKEIEILNKKNAEISRLEKEIESLREGNDKIPELKKEIEILRKENNRIIKSATENETLLKQSVKISNLEKDIETLRIKNAKIEMVNKSLSKEILKVSNKREDIETRLTNLTSKTKEIGKLRPKCDRKYKSLPDTNSEWYANSEAGNDDFDDHLSPTPMDTIIVQNSPVADKNIAVRRESDNDNSNEVASVDTGRGSSLANSDTDKSIHSPEYYLNYIPSNGDNIKNKAITDDVAMSKSQTLFGEIDTKSITTIEHKRKQFVCELKSVCHSKRHSHSKLSSPANQTNAAREVSVSVDTPDIVSSKKRTWGVKGKECLEINNSLLCESDAESDLELENIFSTMKMDYNAVSPIPRTPTRVQEVDSTSDSTNFPEKVKKCRWLCDKTVAFMRVVLDLVLSHNRADRDMININDCNKFIVCFESILKAEQTLIEHRIQNTNFNMEIPDGVLSYDNNNFGSISNPESTTSSSKTEREIIQNKKGVNFDLRLSQNVSLSKIHENQNQLLHDDNNSVTISNPSPPDRDTNNMRDEQVKKRLLQSSPISMDGNQKQLLNHSEELAIDDKISQDRDSLGCSGDIVAINQPPIKNSVGKRSKNKKSTKLEKLKKKFKPKYKIKMDLLPPRNLQIKPKQLSPIIKKVTVNDTSASLNDKDAYEKAVKFMAEMNSQQSAKAKSPPKNTKPLMSPRSLGTLKKVINSSGDNQVLQNCSITTRSKRKLSELFDTCTVVITKDPLLYSPRKAKNSTTHKGDEGNNSTIQTAKEDCNSTTYKTNEDNISSSHRATEDNNSAIHRAKENKNIMAHRTYGNKNSAIHTAKESNNSTANKVNENYNSTSHKAKEDNNSTTYKTKEDNISTSHRPTEDNNSAIHRAKEDNNFTAHRTYGNKNSTTHTAKESNNCATNKLNEKCNSTSHKAKEDNNSTTYKTKEDNISTSHRPPEDNNSAIHRAKENNNFTAHRTYGNKNSTTHTAKESNNSATNKLNENCNSSPHKAKEDNNSTTYKTKEDNISTSHRATEDNNSAIHRAKADKNFTAQRTYGNKNSTTYTAKESNNSTTHKVSENYNSMTDRAKEGNSMSHKEEEVKKCTALNSKDGNESSDETPLKKRRRRSSEEPLVQYKRVLRSSTLHSRLSTEDNTEQSKSKGECNRRLSTEDNTEQSKSKGECNRKSRMGPSANESDTQFNKENTLQYQQLDQPNNNAVSYTDLDIFSEDIIVEKKMSDPITEVNTDETVCHPKESILCFMIEKYGVETIRPYAKRLPESAVKKISDQIEENIAKITHTNDNKNAISNFIEDLRKLDYKHLIAGLLRFLAEPERKLELIEIAKARVVRKVPSMTKAEGILLYAIQQLKTHWPSVDFVEAVLCSIEFSLFKLSRTPEFDVIESKSHFYALLCKHFKTKSRLRLFILDAMYCIQFKSVSLIKQCLEVWEQLLPLQHMGTAKSPLMICLVYLLNFYKCDDKYKRVSEIKQILRKQYYYEISDWNESTILEMFRNCINDLRDVEIEKKMLRLALIILAKRQGTQWCQNRIIKNLLQPMIDKDNIPNNVKEFCVSMIGPLMKPYPVDMKVHCEIAINQLMDILNKNPSPKMEEAAITSMIYINRHDQRSINKMLLSRKMKYMTPALENSIRNYVKAKPLKIWKKQLGALARNM